MNCIELSYVIRRICATILASINSGSVVNCLHTYPGASMGQTLLNAVAEMTFEY